MSIAKTELLRCPYCGATEKLTLTTEELGACYFCNSTFVVKIAKEFYKIEVDRAKDIKNLRKLLDDAAEKNHIAGIKSAAGKIKEIIPEDYTARYFYAYAAKRSNVARYMEEFYRTDEKSSTAEEREKVISHIMRYCELRDYDEVKKYIKRADTAFLAEFERVFCEREQQEEHYSCIPRSVFICHRSTDKRIALAAMEHIEEDGHECWISHRNLRPNDSENYWDNIEKAIEKCQIFLVIGSHTAMLSSDVVRETEIAERLNKPRIEYKIDDKRHTTWFKHFFDGIKWIDASDDPYGEFGTLCERVFEEKRKLKTGRSTVSTAFAPIAVPEVASVMEENAIDRQLREAREQVEKIRKEKELAALLAEKEKFAAEQERIRREAAEAERRRKEAANPASKYKNAKAGQLVEFGSYPQTASGTDKTPIRWRVLENDGKELYLLSEKILDCAAYNTEKKDIAWRDCTLRKWLNNDFYNAAFSAGEKGLILLTRCTGNGVGSKNELPETDDKVFLLNTREAEAMGNDEKRAAQGTEYAKKKGLWVSDGKYGGKGNSFWRLRNRGSFGASYAPYVNISGIVYADGISVIGGDFGVRPVLKLNLKS